MRKRTKAILTTIGAFALSCAFIAAYDPFLDKGAVQLQQKVDAFLVDLEKTSGTPEGEYENHVAFYEEVRGDLDLLRDHAVQQKGNELTLRSLDLVEANVSKLEKLHAEGITADEIALVRTLFDTQFRMLVQFENAKKRKES